MGIHCVKLVRGSKLGVSLLKSFGHFGHTWHFSRTPGSVIVYDPRLLSQHALCGSPHISACYILRYTGALWCPQVYAIKMSGVNQNPSQNHERVKFCALKKKKKKATQVLQCLQYVTSLARVQGLKVLFSRASTLQAAPAGMHFYINYEFVCLIQSHFQAASVMSSMIAVSRSPF